VRRIKISRGKTRIKKLHEEHKEKKIRTTKKRVGTIGLTQDKKDGK
jgi:hypothetical protein